MKYDANAKAGRSEAPPARSAVDDDHLAAGLVCLHHAVRLTNLFEAEDPRWLDVEPAGRGIRGNLLKRHIGVGKPGVPNTKLPKKLK